MALQVVHVEIGIKIFPKTIKNRSKNVLNLERHLGIDFLSFLEAKMEPSWEGKSISWRF